MMPYKDHWGKSDRVGQKLWRPYVEHVAAVALVAQKLVQLSPALRQNLQAALGGLSEEALLNLVGWVAVNHDIGKLHPCFQWKSEEGYKRVYGDLKSLKDFKDLTFLKKYYHGTGGYFWALELKIPGWREDLEPFLRASCAHHGGYASQEDLIRLDAFGKDRPELVLTREAMTAFYQETINYYKPVSLTGIQDLNRLSQIFAGLVAVADWLGSNEDYFPIQEDWILRSISEALSCPALQQKAWNVVSENGFMETPKKWGQMAPPGNGFSSLQDYVGSLTGDQVVIVEAPTGDGKTEAALKLAQGWFSSGVADRIVFALPTKATANAMLGRVAKFAREVFLHDVQVQLAHGDAYHAMKSLRHHMGTNDASRLGFDWFKTGKRKLLSPVSVCTIDQILASVLKGNRHHFVKTYALSSAIVVIDEVHAVDVYMGRTLEELLKNLTALGARVILLSATLSPNLRNKLLTSFGGSVNTTVKGYPLVTSWSKANGARPQAEKSRRADREVAIKVIKHAWDSDSFKAAPKDCMKLTESLVQSVRDGAGVCWIRNSVAEAQQAAEDAQVAGLDKDQIYLLHAGLRGADRRNIENRILKNFGPDGARDPMLVIGTQILEQSLDIDFDRLVRDLSTVDSLIQALGRCHRHPRNKRPQAHKEPVLEVFMPVDLPPEDNLYAYIHKGKLHPLKKTWAWLDASQATKNPTVKEPSGVPQIIEDIFDGQGFPLEARATGGRHTRDVGKAQTHIIQIFDDGLEEYGISDGMDYKAPTRLGEPNRLFLFLADIAGKDGIFRLSDGPEMLDLNPFKSLMGENDLKVIKAFTGANFGEWARVLNYLRDFACSRSTFQETDKVTVAPGNSDQWVTLLERLLEAEKYPTVTVIRLNSLTEMAPVTRVRAGNRFRTQFEVGYCNFQGFLISKV